MNFMAAERNRQEEMTHLTPPQVSRRLGVAVQTVYTWIRSGELDACNLAGVGTVRPRYRISLADLDAFLKCRSVSPAPKMPRRPVWKMPPGVPRLFSVGESLL